MFAPETFPPLPQNAGIEETGEISTPISLSSALTALRRENGLAINDFVREAEDFSAFCFASAEGCCLEFRRLKGDARQFPLLLNLLELVSC